VLPLHSHYLQSKVVRARERIEAELKVAEEDAAAADPGSRPKDPPPPPPTTAEDPNLGHKSRD
jgi:mitochondrial import inner membrane translocase subunit TIM16